MDKEECHWFTNYICRSNGMFFFRTEDESIGGPYDTQKDAEDGLASYIMGLETPKETLQ